MYISLVFQCMSTYYLSIFFSIPIFVSLIFSNPTLLIFSHPLFLIVFLQYHFPPIIFSSPILSFFSATPESSPTLFISLLPNSFHLSTQCLSQVFVVVLCRSKEHGSEEKVPLLHSSKDHQQVSLKVSNSYEESRMRSYSLPCKCRFFAICYCFATCLIRLRSVYVFFLLFIDLL